MADEPRRSHADEVSRYWDELTAGRAPDRGGLSPAEAETIALLVIRARRAQPPPGARARAHRSAQRHWTRAQAKQNGRNIAMDGTLDISRPFVPTLPGRARPLGPPTRARPSRWAQLYAGTVVLLLTVGALIYLFYQGANQATPPAVPGSPPAVASPTSDWPMYRGNPARSGEMPGPAPSGQPTIRWQFDAHSSTRLAPAVIGDTVYLPSDGGPFFALDAASGAVTWQVRSADAMPTVTDGIVYMLSPDRTGLVALDAVTQEELWRVTPGSGYWTPLVVGDTLYYGGGSKHLLIALDARTGEVRWQSAQDGTGSRSAAYADGMLVVGSGDGKVYGIDAATGATAWSYEAGIGPTTQTPAIADGRVYVGWFGGEANAFVALDLRGGQELWRFAGEGSEGFWAPAAAGGRVFVPSDGGRLIALDGATGAVQWTYGATAPMKSAPAVVDGVVYAAGDEGLLLALDAATGTEQWRVPLDGAVTFGPVVSGGSIYAGTSAGILYAIGDAAGVPASPVATPAPTEAAAALGPVQFVWARSGDATHALSSPGAAAIDPFGRLWVSSMPGSFFIFDLDGNLLETWGTPGRGEGEFQFTDTLNTGGTIAFAPDGGFYVADFDNHRVQQFDRDRTFVRAWGARGTGDGEFVAPFGIAIDSQGNVLVADAGRDDIQRFSADGQFLGTIGATGDGPGQLNDPMMITVAPDGTIWVAEGVNNRIQVFNPDYSPKFTFGSYGGGKGTFDMPVQVAFDAAGNVYVADQSNSQVQVFDGQGRFRYEWGSYGVGDGLFKDVGGVVVNRGGAIYVVDWHNDRIQKFVITGELPPPAEATPVS